MMDQIRPAAISHYGGKGATLLHLREKGYPVPKLWVIPVSFFEPFQQDALQIPGACKAFLGEWETYFGAGTLLAVRSSAVAEDGLSHSFAGQFTSLLNVSFDDLPAAVLSVWQSGNSDRVAAYSQSANVRPNQGMAVILQEMVPATAAGVGFGQNPLNGEDELVINAVAGLGDKLVDGSENGAAYIVKNGKIQASKAIPAPVLSDDQVLKVAACIQQLNDHFRHPQDVEFAFTEDAFFLLQSRPVTTGIQGERIIWDNSNIVESYPALTLPLTFSFIEKMYEAVYRQFALVLGVSPETVVRNETVYANMLGLLNGRVYYNLNSWYRALAQLPGYSLNAAFMEKMMGVKEKPDIDVSRQLNASKWASWKDIGMAAYRIIGNLRSARKEKTHFVAAFDRVYQQYVQKDFSKQTLAEIWADYSRFETLMVREWKAPLSNDFFAMVYFGLLQKQCTQYLPEDTELHNRLLAGSDDIITTEPLKRLPVIAAQMAADATLYELALSEDAATVWKQLQQSRHQVILEQINSYLKDWGERCVAELKLETITYTQQPERLIAILQSYITNGIFTYQQSDHAVTVRNQAEALIMRRLKGHPIRRRLFFHILRNARYFVSNRENLRYYRTKAFGMVRKMMTAFGERLHNEHFLDTPADIFYLKLNEVHDLSITPRSMHAIIQERSAEYALFEQLPLPPRMETTGKPTGTMLMPATAHTTSSDSLTMQGIPCSEGVVRSKVYKVDHASALQSLNGGIMATYATDPGYVVLFATASGILTERGSLLSHAAIVSREMGIPCIVGIEGLMSRVQDGDELLMDGSTGVVKILKRHE